MRALRKEMIVETRASWTPVVIEGSRSEVKAAPAAVTSRGMFKNMALFLSAPFVGLLYAVLLPFVGLGMLAWFAARSLYESGKLHAALRVAKRAAVIAAAPFVGLAYVIVMPFAGIGMLAWYAVRGRAPAAS